MFRSDRDNELEFSLTGGYNRGYGIFVESVQKNSTAYKKGLKRGDQILDVNGENFQLSMTLDRAVEFLTRNNFLQINVKSNFLVFKEITSSSDKSRKITTEKQPRPSVKKKEPSVESGVGNLSIQGSSRHKNSTRMKLFGKLEKILKKPSIILNPDDIDSLQSSNLEEGFDLEDAIPEHSLKIYKADHTYRFLLVNKNTTAREVVMLSLKEFGITDCSTNFALFKVSC